MCVQLDLKKTVAELSSSVAALQLELARLKESQTHTTVEDPQAKRDSAATHDVPQSLTTSNTVSFTRMPPTKSNGNVPSDTSSRKLDNRQLNVVVYGIPECTKGQPRKQRWVSDLRNVSNLFNESSASVPKSAIRDCRRLGKYSDTSSRPRPILVYLNSCNVVMDLLQNRSLFSPYVINPDLPADVRLREKALLKVRWNLIQSGTCKSHIKIKGNTLLVTGLPYGRVDQSCSFVRLDHDQVRDSSNPPHSRAVSSTPPPPPSSQSSLSVSSHAASD